MFLSSEQKADKFLYAMHCLVNVQKVCLVVNKLKAQKVEKLAFTLLFIV